MNQHDELECPTCDGYGDCWSCGGDNPVCCVCDGTNDCSNCSGVGSISNEPEEISSLRKLLGEAIKESQP